MAKHTIIILDFDEEEVITRLVDADTPQDAIKHLLDTDEELAEMIDDSVEIEMVIGPNHEVWDAEVMGIEGDDEFSITCTLRNQ